MAPVHSAAAPGSRHTRCRCSRAARSLRPSSCRRQCSPWVAGVRMSMVKPIGGRPVVLAALSTAWISRSPRSLYSSSAQQGPAVLIRTCHLQVSAPSQLARSGSWRLVAMVCPMQAGVGSLSGQRHAHMLLRAPTGAALLAIELSERARGIQGLDLLRRSVDRAPPP